MPVPLAAMGIMAGGSALANLAGGYFSSQAQKEAAQAAADAQIRATQMGIDEQRAIYGDVQDIWSPYKQIGDRSLSQLASGVESGAFATPEMGQFDFSGQVSDYLDPSMQYQQEQAQRALEQSASAGGGLTSGATLQALQNQAQDYGMQDWGDSFNRMQTDKNFAYQDFINRFNNKRQNVRDRYSQIGSLANLGTNAASSMSNARVGTGNQITGLFGDQGNAQAVRNMAGPQATANMWQQGTAALGDALGTGMSLYNTYGGQGNQPIDYSGTNEAHNIYGNYQGINPMTNNQSMQGYVPGVESTSGRNPYTGYNLSTQGNI